MSMQETPTTPFENVRVTVTTSTDSSGNISYDATFDPEVLGVGLPDTVINYQLVSPTPADISIIDLTVVPASGGQLSPPSFSTSGKMVTFSDANTVEETLNVTLHFGDSQGVKFKVDPQIINRPT